MSVVLLLDRMFSIYLLGSFGLKYSSSSMFPLLTLFLSDPSIIESGIVKSPTLVVAIFPLGILIFALCI